MTLVRFHADAEAEMTDAAAYYERQHVDLGKRFLATVQDAVNRIQINPLLFPVVEYDVRRCRVKTFPYDVLFQILDDQIVVIAVMHLHREPNYWKTRHENG
jgi:toxin ParE1/3/4